MQEDGVEWELVFEFKTHHDHSSHPEEEDITTCFEKVSWIERLQVICLFWPSHSCKWEKTRGEPSIEDILILSEFNFRGINTESLGSVFQGFLMVTANNEMVVVVDIWVVNHSWDLDKIHWDSVTPPKLSGDAPVLDVFEPLVPSFLVELWNDLEILVSDGINRSFGHIFAINIPLWLEEWLNDIITLRAHTKSHWVWSLSFNLSEFFKSLVNLNSCLKTS